MAVPEVPTPGPDWSRPHWQRDEAKALLLYFVFGHFDGETGLDQSHHDSAGLPPGVEMRRIPRATLAHWEGHPLCGALGGILRDADPAAFEAARTAPGCLMLRGELPDPSSLTYLRDALGVVAALLDAGGVAVVDPQILDLFGAEQWRTRYAGAGRAEPRNHVAILCSDGEAGETGQWVHTRGMRKFARPDVSIRRVAGADIERAGALAAKLAALLARGMRFGDGSTIEIEGMPDGLDMTLGGSPEDPAFNNTHLEVAWPAP